MKRVVLTILVASAAVCSLVLSASATVRLAADVGVPGGVQPFAIGMLEVVSLAGTWTWVTDVRLRAESAVAVVLASAVTGIAGVHAYGAFGLIAPVGLIVTVHLVSRAWTVDAGLDPNLGNGFPEPVHATATVEAPGELQLGHLDVELNTEGADPQLAKVRQIVAGGGGRGTVAAELGVTRDQARGLIDKVRAA